MAGPQANSSYIIGRKQVTTPNGVRYLPASSTINKNTSPAYLPLVNIESSPTLSFER